MTKLYCKEDSKMNAIAPAEPTETTVNDKRKEVEEYRDAHAEPTVNDERKQKFIARLKEGSNLFNTSSSCIVDMWDCFNAEERNPILNPNEIGQLMQLIVKHFDSLPFKEHCLDNLALFNTSNFYNTDRNTVPFETSEPIKETDDDRKERFIERLKKVHDLFNTASSCIVDLWDCFDPAAFAPILNPDEIGQLVQLIAKHFDSLPFKEHCLDNFAVFNIEKFYEEK
jgi:hypothetical protein